MRNDLRTTIQDWYQQQNRAIKSMFLDEACNRYYSSFSIPIQTIRDGVTGKRCTAKTAKAIASAWGYPARWPELVIVTKKEK